MSTPTSFEEIVYIFHLTFLLQVASFFSFKGSPKNESLSLYIDKNI